MKYFLLKLKDVGLSLLPIVLVVLVLHFGFCRFETELLIKFIVSLVIIVFGEVFFLTGVDGSIMQMGDLVGNSTNKISRVAVVVFFGFIFGLFATIAEPDLNVLSEQALKTGLINIPKLVFVFIVGLGTGMFIAVALLRIIRDINYKLVILAIFVCAFILAMFVPNSLIALAFDAGGATTGIITAPFLLAISSGLARNRNKVSHSDNFGVIGIASVGPILAVLFLSIISAGNSSADKIASSLQMNIFLDVLVDAMLALIPLITVFLIFNAIFLKISKKKKLSIILGVLVTFVGLYLFLFGIDYGMISMGEAVGEFLSTMPSGFAIIISIVVGFLITFTEPSVRVLGAQVEEITLGNIRKNFVTIAIAISMMLAVSLSTVKIISDISIWWIIGIGYGLIIILMPFSNTTFVSIAFDSGGVASGPMSAAFVLPIMIGFASKNGGAAEGFGLIAIIVMMPILTIEFLGVFYKTKIKVHDKKEYKHALRVSYGLNMYSNIDSLEESYNRRQALKAMQQESAEKLQEEILVNQQLEMIKAMKENNNEEITG